MLRCVDEGHPVRTPGADFEVDRCGGCGGVWLDKNEIRKVQEILTEERKLWLKIVGRLDEVVLRERDLSGEIPSRAGQTGSGGYVIARRMAVHVSHETAARGV